MGERKRFDVSHGGGGRRLALQPGLLVAVDEHGEARVATPEFLRNERPLWFRFDTRSFSDTDPSERRLHPPGRLADGFAISRDTDMAALFR